MIMGQVATERNSLRNMLFDDWSNDACCGYALIALKNLQIPDKLIEQILQEMNFLFTDVGVVEAREMFRNREN